MYCSPTVLATRAASTGLVDWKLILTNLVLRTGEIDSRLRNLPSAMDCSRVRSSRTSSKSSCG